MGYVPTKISLGVNNLTLLIAFAFNFDIFIFRASKILRAFDRSNEEYDIILDESEV